VHIPLDVGEFQLIDRVVLEALKKFDDYYPYIRGMIASCGFRSMGIEYVWVARKASSSKNRLYHLVDQGMNGMISFTNAPLRLCLYIGFILAFVSLIYAVAQLALNVMWFRKIAPPGIATLIVAIFFFAGVQLFYLGVLGEYIGAIHGQVRKRPLVIERERINF
jgi:glycosyltransferase involved in cell wall biosynthesis